MTTFWRFNNRWGWTKLFVIVLCAATIGTAQASSSASLYNSTCDGDTMSFHNGFCDSINNNQGCGWDGGDCCECTCKSTDDNTCGDYVCDDPDPDCGPTTRLLQEDGDNFPTSLTPAPTPALHSPVTMSPTLHDSSTPTFTKTVQPLTPTGSISDGGVGRAFIGGICAAGIVVLFAVCAGVYCIRARKGRDSTQDRARPVQYPVSANPQGVQYPVPAGPQGVHNPVSAGLQRGGSDVSGQAGSRQFPVAV